MRRLWAAVTMRHSSAQPVAPSRARKTARAADSSTKAPPLTGLRRREEASAESVRMVVAAGLPATARSTPNRGRIPASAAARAKRTAPHEGVAVGEGEGVHAPLGGAFRQPFRVGASVAHGEPRNGVQMRKTGHPRPPAFPRLNTSPVSTIEQFEYPCETLVRSSISRSARRFRPPFGPPLLRPAPAPPSV